MADATDTLARLVGEAVANGWRPDDGAPAARRLLKRLSRLKLLDPDCGDGAVLAAATRALGDLATRACAAAGAPALLRLRTTALAGNRIDAWAMSRRLEVDGAATQIRLRDPFLGAGGTAARWPRADLIVSGRAGRAGTLSAAKGQPYADALWRLDQGRFRSARPDLLLLDRALCAVARHGGVAVMAFDPTGQEDAWAEIRLQIAAERRPPRLDVITLADGRQAVVAQGVARARASAMAGSEPKRAGPWSRPMSLSWAEATTVWSAPSIWRGRD
ncbi:MAG: hypothetical protein EON91_08210 [Brevundimonas sp.]|uniref:hypothetical protein n=1 Tax=Brevundimonas sp. TaxID=1871086 RepID=UPI001217CB47|nr:hypothetical protein [Brevundimonas sp.]RZJ17729.1 MAG: hypothetical protein EON91_08210 [Brevundimonas sp.]